jgi:prepilin-type N-terminal cleavage/methylation domain-containing protein
MFVKHTQEKSCVCFFFTSCFTIHNPKNKSGFTLIELIIVLLILAILGAAVNLLIGDTASTKAYGTARKIQSDIIFAQESAMTHRVHYRITFSALPNSYTIQQCTTWGVSSCTTWGPVLDPSTNTSPFMVTLNTGSYTGVSLSTTFNCSYLEFNSAGNPLEGDNSNCLANPPLLFSTTGATIRTVALNTTTRYVMVLAGTGKTAVYP